MQKKVKFEEAMAKLDSVVSKIESGGLTLDESIAAFEEGVKLIKICNESLESAENKVRLLTENSDGTVSDVPFEVSDNET